MTGQPENGKFQLQKVFTAKFGTGNRDNHDSNWFLSYQFRYGLRTEICHNGCGNFLLLLAIV
jgi:hypothetical protein